MALSTIYTQDTGKVFIRSYWGEKGCLRKAHKQGKSLANADFSRTSIWASTLDKLDLTDTRLHRAYITHARWTGLIAHRASFKGALLKWCQLEGADFTNGRLRHMSVRESRLQKANFTTAYLESATFEQTNLSEAQFSRARMDWMRAKTSNLSATCLHDVEWRKGTLEACQLADLKATKANLQGTSFIGCLAHNASFRSAKLDEAKFRRGDFSHADFRKASMVGASFRATKLAHADFREADLSRADFKGADLTLVDLSGAKLTGADFRGARMTGTVINETTFNSLRLRDLLDYDGMVVVNAEGQMVRRYVGTRLVRPDTPPAIRPQPATAKRKPVAKPDAQPKTPPKADRRMAVLPRL